MSKILFILSIFLGTFSFSNELNEIRITSENYSLFENIIKVDLDKNTKLFKKSLEEKITNVEEINHNIVNVYKINKHNLLFLITSNTLDNSTSSRWMTPPPS